MFRKKDNNKLDIETLNEVISLGKKILNISFFMIIMCLILFGTYLIKEWHVLSFIKDFFIVILPIFIGLIIAWLFDPLVKWLQGKKVPRIVGCIVVYIVFLSFLTLIIYLIVPSFIGQIKDFISGIPEILKELKNFVNNFIGNASGVVSYDLSVYKKDIYEYINNIGTSITTNLPKTLINVFTSVISGGATFILGLMIGFYMLFDFDKLNRNILGVMPKNWRGNAQELMVRVNNSLRGYVQGVLIIMFLVFITQSIGLTLAGLKAPLVFALFCAITDVIPYFGPYIGAIPAVIVGFTMSPVVGVFCIVSIVVVQLLENNFYQPLIMGHTMKLHPVTIMIGLLIFQHFFGIIGMIIATPVIASLKVIITFINEKTKLVKSEELENIL